MVLVNRTEEKGSDVNLATYLVLDGFKGEYDEAIVVSNDSDLVEPIRVVQSQLGLRVGVLNPHIDKWGKATNRSRELQQVADFCWDVWPSRLRQSQFPATLTDAVGTITKPQCWP